MIFRPDSLNHKQCRKTAFTLIELLTVIAIIGILAGLLFAVANAVRNSARASRANAEIAAIDTALTRFEIDFGFYPEISFIGVDDEEYVSNFSDENLELYRNSSRALFLAVQGVGFFGDNIPPGFEPSTTQRSFIDLNATQVAEIDGQIQIVLPVPGQGRNNRSVYHEQGNFNEGPYIVDPWGFPYGYFYRSRAETNSIDQPPHFEQGQRSLHNFDYFDLWSTRDALKDEPSRRWITNWRN